ncbi:hypothetical protein M3Y99_00166200 [Aphelenchoides fujianensis]|nr:hypothetical protein M3Y99_00166200 [Aphelenchoides fujianensis]
MIRRPLLIFFLLLSLNDHFSQAAEDDTLGSRTRRMAEDTDEAAALQKVAEMMKAVRSKDVGRDLQPEEAEGSGEFVENSDLKAMDSVGGGGETPCFSVFPPTHDFDRVHVRIHRDPLNFMWKKLELEDFAEMSALRPQFGISELDVNATLSASADDRAGAFFERVVRNLLNALPTLQRVRLGGGYRFESTEMDVPAFLDHLANLHANFAELLLLLKQRGLEVQFPNYAVEFKIPEETVREFGENTLKDALDVAFRPSASKWSREKAEIQFETEGIATNLSVVVGSPFPKREFAPHCANKSEDPADEPKIVAYRSAGFNESEGAEVKNTTAEQEECVPEVFSANVRELDADELFVEDFVNRSALPPQTQLEALNLSVSVANSPVLSFAEFYERAAANLRQAAPGLKSVGLFGTLRYYPMVSTLPEFRSELLDIKRSVEAMSRAMKRNFVRVEWIEPPTFVFAVEKEMLKRLQGGDLVKTVDVFNYSELEIANGRIFVKFEAENGMQTEFVFVLTAFHPRGFSSI